MNELVGGRGAVKLREMSNNILSNIGSVSGYTRKNAEMSEYSEVLYICLLKASNLWLVADDNPYYDQTKIRLSNEIVAESKKQSLTTMKNTTEVFDFVESVVYPRLKQYLPKGKEKESGDGQQQSSGKPEEKKDGQQQASGKPEEKQEQQQEGSSGEEQAQSEQQGDSEENSGLQEDQYIPKGKYDSEESWVKELEEKVRQSIVRGRVNPDEENREANPFQGSSNRKPPVRNIHPELDFQKHVVTAKPLKRVFKNKFENIFKDNQISRFSGNFRSGRLSARKLYKHGVGNPRLFQRRGDRTAKGYSFAFLTDVSGSMFMGGRMENTCIAMSAFLQIFNDLNMRTAVGFYGGKHFIAKEFDERKLDWKSLSEGASRVSQSWTEIDSLYKELVIKRLQNERTEVKIAIILTDGSWSESGYKTVKDFSRLHKEIKTYVIGLEIDTDTLQKLLGEEVEVVSATDTNEIMQRYAEIAGKYLLS